ncbi:MAG: hypothetical protein ACI8S2_001540 [Bacteroidia bacterium]|jgi:hypothetical protein
MLGECKTEHISSKHLKNRIHHFYIEPVHYTLRTC